MQIFLATNPDGSHFIFLNKPTRVKTYRTDPPEEWVGSKLPLSLDKFPHLTFPPDYTYEPLEADLVIRQKVGVEELKERLKNG
jgi:hypothetical protein